MSNALLLDVLFGIIALLFIPIGLRRGVLREVFVAAGVLTGSQLSASWARPWGGDLASQIDVRVGIGQFAVSALFLIGATLLLGYGGSAAARPPEPGLWGRLCGALLAVTNGALLAAFILRDIELFLADAGTERALEKSHVAWTLLRQFGWVAIGASVLMLIPILISLVLGRRSERTFSMPQSVAPTWQEPPPPPARKPRLAWGSDEGKVEPSVRMFDPANGRYGADAPSAQQTIPIAPVDPGTWSADRAQRPDPRPGEWLEIVTRDHAEWPARTTGAFSVNGDRRCPGCGESMTAEDMFCPRCGRARSAQEGAT